MHFLRKLNTQARENKMVGLSCISIARSRIILSQTNNNNTSSSSSSSPLPPPPRPNRKPPVRRISPSPPPPPSIQLQQQRQQKQEPSVSQIERAIGAGIFRDRDTTNRDSGQENTLFDSILSNSIGRTEGSVEKKLRETGEWIIDRTEGGSSRSAGKNILRAVFLLILPMWILSFLVASGVVSLPFGTPFLDDLIM